MNGLHVSNALLELSSLLQNQKADIVILKCELVDSRTTKPDAVVWGHNYGIVVNRYLSTSARSQRN
jgi:hypothetical protein